eukprot:403350039
MKSKHQNEFKANQFSPKHLNNLQIIKQQRNSHSQQKTRQDIQNLKVAVPIEIEQLDQNFRKIPDRDLQNNFFEFEGDDYLMNQKRQGLQPPILSFSKFNSEKVAKPRNYRKTTQDKPYESRFEIRASMKSIDNHPEILVREPLTPNIEGIRGRSKSKAYRPLAGGMPPLLNIYNQARDMNLNGSQQSLFTVNGRQHGSGKSNNLTLSNFKSSQMNLHQQTPQQDGFKLDKLIQLQYQQTNRNSTPGNAPMSKKTTKFLMNLETRALVRRRQESSQHSEILTRFREKFNQKSSFQVQEMSPPQKDKSPSFKKRVDKIMSTRKRDMEKDLNEMDLSLKKLNSSLSSSSANYSSALDSSFKSSAKYRINEEIALHLTETDDEIYGNEEMKEGQKNNLKMKIQNPTSKNNQNSSQNHMKVNDYSNKEQFLNFMDFVPDEVKVTSNNPQKPQNHQQIQNKSKKQGKKQKSIVQEDKSMTPSKRDQGRFIDLKVQTNFRGKNKKSNIMGFGREDSINPPSPSQKRRQTGMQVSSPIKLGKSLFHLNNNPTKDSKAIGSNLANGLLVTPTKKLSGTNIKNNNGSGKGFKGPTNVSIKNAVENAMNEEEQNQISLSYKQKASLMMEQFKIKRDASLKKHHKKEKKTPNEELKNQSNKTIDYHNSKLSPKFMKQNTLNLYSDYNRRPSSNQSTAMKQFEFKSVNQVLQLKAQFSSSYQTTVPNNDYKPPEENYKGSVMIDRKRKQGIRIMSSKKLNDQDMMDLLLHVVQERVDSISIPNCELSDAGASILFEFLNDQTQLSRMKLCNNIMELVTQQKEIPYMLTGTSLLGMTLMNKTNLQVFELHGFFFHHDDYDYLFEGLQQCKQLRSLTLSNNNIQDYGVEQLSYLIEDPTMNLQILTLLNNNINDDGGIALADALFSEHSKLQQLNLRMNFIKDNGAAYFVDGFMQQEGGYKTLQKCKCLSSFF